MPLQPPLEEWDHVTRTVTDPLSSTISFSVTDDGIWTEQLTGLFPIPPEPETGHLNRWELWVLDAIVDQINRGSIPDQVQPSTSPGDDLGRYLDLTNDDAATYRLSSEDRGGSYVRADDPFDRLEIAALDVFMRYLDHKYGSFSDDAIIA
jgi:hypothetical protein